MRVQMRVTPALAAAACLLTACSNADQKAESGAEKAAAPALKSRTGANAQAMTPRPGLWSQTFQNSAMPEKATLKSCVGPLEADENPFGPDSEDTPCSQYSIRPTPGGAEFSAVCSNGDMTMTSSGRVAGDMNRAYRAEIDIRTEGPDVPAGMARGRLIIDAVRLGDCPAGVEPGDIVP